MIEKLPPRNRELSEGLLRQRRNLFISSISLIVFVALGFEMEQIKILGNTAKVNAPNVVPVIIFIAHAYFTLRYFQYYKEENHRVSITRVIKENIARYEVGYLEDKAKCKLDKLYKFKSVNFSFPRFKEVGMWDGEESGEDDVISISSRRVEVYAQIYSSDRVDVFDCYDLTYLYKSEFENSSWLIADRLASQSGVRIKSSIECSNFVIIGFRCLGFLKCLFIQSDFSDYMLPFLLSFFAFLFGGIVYFDVF